MDSEKWSKINKKWVINRKVNKKVNKKTDNKVDEKADFKQLS